VSGWNRTPAASIKALAGGMHDSETAGRPGDLDGRTLGFFYVEPAAHRSALYALRIVLPLP
jgi:hypothetical protein